MRKSAIRALSSLHTLLIRRSGGRLGRHAFGIDFLLLTTRGRKSGNPHTVPLLYLRAGNDWAVIASLGGRPSHPDWFKNLVANAEVEVQINGERRRARARVATASERDRLWAQAVAVYPDYETYQSKTDRVIPVVILERSSPL